MANTRKIVMWSAGGVLVILIGFIAIGKLTQHKTTGFGAATASQYLAEHVTHGSFSGSVTASGTIVPTTEATIESPSTTGISQIGVKLGQKVSANASVATLANGASVDSPIAGTVVSIAESSGNYVTAGETIATVANLSTLYASITVPEESITQVKAGQSATITLPSLPGKSFTGTVVSVGELGSSSSSGSVTYPVNIAITAPSEILLGMSASVSIDTGNLTNALYVPTSAIETVNGQDEVLVPQKNLPTPSFSGFGGGSGGNGYGGFSGGGFGGTSTHGSSRNIDRTIPVGVKVTVGLSNGTDTQILSGLSKNEQILVPTATSATTTTTHGGGFGGAFGGVGGFGGIGG